MATIEVYADKSGGYRWRMKAPNGQTTASSGEAFSSRSNAVRAGRTFSANAAKHVFEVTTGRTGKSSWKAKARNGQTVATAGETFADKSTAKRAATAAQKAAAKATGP